MANRRHLLALSYLSDAPLARRVDIPRDALAEIAERIGLPELRSLSADITIRLRQPEMIELTGRLSADLRQVCVVMLEPFDSELNDQFQHIFTTDPARAAEDVADPLDAAAWPELLEDDGIDLAEFLIQQLALSLDPHPRAPGATFEAEGADGLADDVSRTTRPFANLPELLTRDK